MTPGYYQSEPDNPVGGKSFVIMTPQVFSEYRVVLAIFSGPNLVEQGIVVPHSSCKVVNCRVFVLDQISETFSVSWDISSS